MRKCSLSKIRAAWLGTVTLSVRTRNHGNGVSPLHSTGHQKGVQKRGSLTRVWVELVREEFGARHNQMETGKLPTKL